MLAASHIHSTWSYDGTFSLQQLAATFSKRQNHVLLMTEHDRSFTQARFEEFRNACSAASSGRLLLVPGIEYSDAENRVHILTWGLDRFLGENLATSALLLEVQQAGGIAVLAHPSRKAAYSLFEQPWAECLWGIEAWNRKYDGWAPSHSAFELLRTSKLVPFVGLDFHTSRQLFPLAMALDIDGELSEVSVICSLRERRCRARALGRDLNALSGGLPRAAMCIAEQGRRAARGAFRGIKGVPNRLGSRI
jgi:hypothetical protein